MKKQEFIEAVQSGIEAALEKFENTLVTESNELFLNAGITRAEKHAANLQALLVSLCSLFGLDVNWVTWETAITPLIKLAPAARLKALKVRLAEKNNLVPAGLNAEAAADLLSISADDLSHIEKINQLCTDVGNYKEFPAIDFWCDGDEFALSDAVHDAISERFTKSFDEHQMRLLKAVALAELVFQEVADLIEAGDCFEYMKQGNSCVQTSSMFNRVTDVLGRKLTTGPASRKEIITTPDNSRELVINFDSL
jgi:hypothetical protein